MEFFQFNWIIYIGYMIHFNKLEANKSHLLFLYYILLWIDDIYIIFVAVS